MWLRLRQIALIARELQPIVDGMHEILGLEVGYRDPGVKVFGLQNAIFPVGNQFIEVVSPIQEGTAGGRYLERRRGDGGYMVICQCDDHAPRKRRVAELGIRKALEQDTREYSIMQLHPRDTGGSFLEIDYQHGGESPDGPWEPAGKNWQKAVHTDVVRGIAAAEIQSSEPDALSKRWSEIMQLPIAHDSESPTLRLENASIRFVKDADGRGEGLGGLDLIASDRARAMKVAEHRGSVSNGQVVICGMRINLV